MKFSYLYLTVLAFASTAVGQVKFTSGLNLNKCMDLRGGVTANGTPIQIWDCADTTNQLWIVNFTVPDICSARNPNFCIDANGTPGPGTGLVINARNTAFASQRVVSTIFGDLIELLATGLCIGVAGSDTTNGGQLQLELCNAEDESRVWNPIQPRRDKDE